MENTVIVEKKIQEALKIIQRLVKKYKLGRNVFFERVEERDTAGLYCFSISIKIGNRELTFPVAISTFGQMYTVSKIGGLRKVIFNFNSLESAFLLELQLAGYNIPTGK